MGTQITADWKDRLYNGLTTLRSDAKLTAERLERIACPYVPGTRPFNRYYQRLMRQDAQEGRHLLISLSDLPGLDRATKRRLFPLVRHHINRLASAEIWNGVVLRLAWWGSFYISLIITIWPLVLATNVRPLISSISLTYASQFTGALWLLLWPVYFITFCLAFLLITCAGFVLLLFPVYAVIKIEPWGNPYFNYWPHRFVIISWPLGVSIAYIGLYAVLKPIANTISSSPSLEWVAFAGVVDGFLPLVLLGMIIMGLISLGCLVFLLNYALEHRRVRLYPEAVITLQLLSMLTRVTTQSAAWGSLEMKHELVARLEIVASYLQYALPRRLASDTATDDWFQQIAEQMATAHRALKAWVLMPKSDTREQFIARITDTFVHVATGEWDALTRSEGEPQTQRQGWRTRVTNVSTAIVIALLPLSGFWGIQQSLLTIPQPVAGYVTIGGLVWLVLTLLISLDTSFHTKLRVMEDVIQSIPFIGKWLGMGKRST